MCIHTSFIVLLICKPNVYITNPKNFLECFIFINSLHLTITHKQYFFFAFLISTRARAIKEKEKKQHHAFYEKTTNIFPKNILKILSLVIYALSL